MAQYEIRLKGQLDESWADWFGGLGIIHQDNGETLLIGALADQAALYGLLNRINTLGIQLISVNLVKNAQMTGMEDVDDHS
jgi:hypothetical protein